MSNVKSQAGSDTVVETMEKLDTVVLPGPRVYRVERSQKIPYHTPRQP